MNVASGGGERCKKRWAFHIDTLGRCVNGSVVLLLKTVRYVLFATKRTDYNSDMLKYEEMAYAKRKQKPDSSSRNESGDSKGPLTSGNL